MTTEQAAPHHLRKRRAFTLFELLLVMGVIAVIAVLAVPALTTMQRTTSLTRAEEEILGELNLARQHAISVNREVEVRFISYKANSIAGNTSQFRAIQSYTYSETGVATPLRIMRSLPPSVIMDRSSTLSSLLAAARNKTWLGGDTQPSLPGIGTTYEACAFRFRADGSTNLNPFPTTPWFITLHDIGAGDNLSAPPKNYTSIVVDPINGQASSYRP